MRTDLIDKETLIDEYLINNLSIAEISNKYSIPKTTLGRILKDYNINKSVDKIRESILSNRRGGILKDKHLTKLKNGLINNIIKGKQVLSFNKRENNKYIWNVKCVYCGCEFCQNTTALKKSYHNCIVKNPKNQNKFAETIENNKTYVLIYDNNGNSTIVDKDQIEKLKNFYWRLGNNGRWVAVNKSRKFGYKSKELFIYNFIMDFDPAKDKRYVVDHINRNPNDNRKCNLRIATKTQNAYNRSFYSETKGIEKICNGLYRSRIMSNGIVYELGFYVSKEQACSIYNVAAKYFFGDYAVLNKINSSQFLKGIILISGKARSGKNYIGDLISESLINRGYSAKELAFADYLKYLCTQYFGYDGTKTEEMRTLLQRQGDVYREYDKDIFVNAIIDVIAGFCGKYDYIIITDTRFVNEIKGMFRKFGALVRTLRIERDGFENDLSKKQREHISETQLDDYSFDFFIKNTDEDDAFVDNQVNCFIDEMIKNPFICHNIG